MEDVGIFYGHLVYLHMFIWYILQPFGIFYVYLVYFTPIWYILCLFGIINGHLVYFMAVWYIFSVLVCFTKKNLATLLVCTIFADGAFREKAAKKVFRSDAESQGCQIALSHTKNPILGKFWRALLVYFIAIWSILRLLGILCGPLVYFVAIWYILWPFGTFCGR
jgi:hypothetical protein